MSIFSRLKTLISSNLNDLINKAEKPEKMLNQLVVDMQEQLLESKKAVALAMADEKKLERELENHLAQAQEWERKAILALKAGKDDLAREALIRKQEYDKGAEEYRKQWEAQKISIEKLKEALVDLQNRIEEAQRKRNLLIARAKSAEAQQKIQSTISSVSGSTSAFDAFDRMAEKVDQMEAQADAYKELEALESNPPLEQQFKELEKSDDSIDTMLEDLRKKIKALPDNTENSDQ